MTDRTLTVLAAALGAALNVINEAIENGDLPTISAGEVEAAQNTTGELLLDKSGLPWDERIHAGTKTQTGEGIWTKRKKLGEGVYEAVVAELRQTYPAPTATVAVPAPATQAIPLPVAAPAPAAPTIAVPNLSMPATKTNYQKLVDFLALNTGAGKSLTSEWVNDQFTANAISLASLASPEHDATAQQFLEAFRGVLASMNIAEVVG